MIILETYTTQKGGELKLPEFLDIAKEVTDNSEYSMYNLSKKDSSEAHKKTAKSIAPTVEQTVNKVTSDVGSLNIANGKC